MRIDLRRAVPADAGMIGQVTREAYAEWIPVIGREPKPTTVDYGEAVMKNRFDLLYVDNDLAGLVETVDENELLLIENVAVSPSFRNMGLGRRLMMHVKALTVQLGHRRSRLYTNKLFSRNVEFYKRLGYRVDSEEEGALGVVVHMSKEIVAVRNLTDEG